MKRNSIITLFAIGVVAGTAFGSGFSLYQYSATANAMGGALVGKAMDASANFINPATLTDLTNTEITVGFVTEHPRGRVYIARGGRALGRHAMEPGLFWLPHIQTSTPLPYNFSFGLGMSPEYGLGTKFSDGWDMRWNCTETTVQSLVFTPNLAYKIGDFSLAAGLRWLYFDFEQTSYPNAPASLGGGHFKQHLKGDNEWKDLGWQIGLKYDIIDNLSAGLVYKSRIDARIVGKSEGKYATSAGAKSMARAIDGDAEAELRLPQSIAAGLNWDITDDWHVGAELSWTEWSSIDTLVFNLNGVESPKRLNWKDTWRGSVATAYDITDDVTAMLSYVYDMDCTSSSQCSVMLPPADRHIASCGVSWHVWDGFYLTVSYSCIFMRGRSMHTTDPYNPQDGIYDVTVSRGFCHAAGASITYRF